MTASNRSKQTYFTLSTISKSIVSDVHIVLVDDSDVDKITVEELSKFNLCIDFIEINKNNKFWVNPCINYNIGFQYIKCPIIILQNAEVCHIGDVCDFVVNNVSDEEYLVFDVANTESYDNNEELYNINYSFSDIRMSTEWKWYNHHSNNLKNYHFLSAFSKKTFDEIEGFSYDYFSQGLYDDDDFLLKIKRSNISVKNIKSEEKCIMGIHQYHKLAGQTWVSDVSMNRRIFEIKSNSLEYKEVSENPEILKILFYSIQ
jgi:hypothetical protein